MRVIGGSKKRLQLQTVPGLHTRPTTDRIKETLFNMLSNQVYDARFLDLFAGSGQIGIEALSRGAQTAVFVENNKNALMCIKKNIEYTDLKEQSTILAGDVLSCISKLQGQLPFDIIFMDPPYHLGVEQKVLEAIASHQILHPEGIIIVEADIDTDFSFVEQLPFIIEKEKQYKTNKHMFLTYKS